MKPAQGKGKTKMKVVYPGSFHPPTIGHIDIITRAAALFDEVVVAVMVNQEKTYLFSAQERVEMLRDCLTQVKNVRVVADGGLLAELCKKEKADAILRGLRSYTDYGYETPLAQANKAIGAPETIYISADPALSHVSSTIVTDIARHHGPLEGFVPPQIIERVKNAFR